MPSTLSNRYDSTRMQSWDYRWSAWYFLTICTDRRLPYFGEVRNGIVGLTPAGCVAARYWQNIEEIHDRAILDVFIVMPNHVHGLLGLLPEEESKEALRKVSSATVDTSRKPDESETDESETKTDRMSEISPEAGSVSTIIRSYKAAVTKRIRGTLRADFGWQSRFYDHIVRTKHTFDRVRHYICTNPVHWKLDRNRPD